jgi:hypothetical protein
VIQHPSGDSKFKVQSLKLKVQSLKIGYNINKNKQAYFGYDLLKILNEAKREVEKNSGA